MKKTIKKPVGASKKTTKSEMMPDMPMAETKKADVKGCCDSGSNCCHGRGFGRWLFGLILVLVGLVYLAKNTGLLPWSFNISWGEVWPVIIVIIGLSMINRRSKLSIFFGVIIAVIAVLLMLFLISFNFSQKTYDQQLNSATQGQDDLFKDANKRPEKITDNKMEDSIKVSNIEPNQKVANPIKISGKAKGTWFFEGTFPIKLISETGEQLGTTTAKAEGDWMTDSLVDFTATISYSKTTSTKAIIIFEKDNPSGLMQSEAAYALPVLLK